MKQCSKWNCKKLSSLAAALKNIINFHYTPFSPRLYINLFRRTHCQRQNTVEHVLFSQENSNRNMTNQILFNSSHLHQLSFSYHFKYERTNRFLNVNQADLWNMFSGIFPMFSILFPVLLNINTVYDKQWHSLQRELSINNIKAPLYFPNAFIFWHILFQTTLAEPFCWQKYG